MPNDCYTNYYLFLYVNLSLKLIVYISISILKQTITLSKNISSLPFHLLFIL